MNLVIEACPVHIPLVPIDGYRLAVDQVIEGPAVAKVLDAGVGH
jgi:hypothetical protein